ncbi:VMAP-C domain-containing protein [Streptomyces sparsus]
MAARAAMRLADALMKVSVLDDLDVRRMCVDNALERLGLRLSVREFAEKKSHLVAMVRAFGAVPDGWRHLAETVQFLADYDLPSQHVASLADPGVLPLHDEAAQDELALLLAGLDRTTLPRLAEVYARASGDRHGPLPEAVHTAWEAYELLSHCNSVPGRAPRTVRFLQELATHLAQERGDEVRRWISREVRAAAESDPEARRILEDSRRGAWERAGRQSHPARLMVRLRPPTGSADRVHVTCWSNTGRTWEPRRRDERLVPSDELQRHVAEIVNREEARLRDHRGGVILEFILPLALLNERVEDWPRFGAFGEQPWGETLHAPLGLDYHVVVRSLERMEALQLHRAWNERWSVLEGESGARAHRCARGDGPARLQLYAHLKHNPSVVLMTLGSPPDDEEGRHELLLGLQAGLPVLIWSHEGALVEEQHTVAEAALKDDRGNFHKGMARLRFVPDRADNAGAASLSSRFAVLWDDPSRLPELPEPIV